MIACCWIPNFLIWVMLQLEPELKGKPLVVQRADRVLAASPEAGPEVVPGILVRRAQALCHDLILRKDPLTQAELLWEDVLQRVNGYTPRLKSLEKGRLLAVLTEDEAAALAGELPARVGLAANAQTAYLAALVATPCKIVRAGGELRFADQFSVLSLASAGIASETIQRLIWLGFPNMGSLRRLTQAQLKARFVSPDGERLYALAHPEHDQTRMPLYYPPPQILQVRFAESAWPEGEALAEVAREMLQTATAELQPNLCSAVTLRLEGENWNERYRRLLKQPTGRFRKLWPPLEKMLTLAAGREVERITLSLNGLQSPAAHQETLFRERSSLKPALQTLHSRFPGKVLRLDAQQGQYLPEEAWCFREA